MECVERNYVNSFDVFSYKKIYNTDALRTDESKSINSLINRMLEINRNSDIPITVSTCNGHYFADTNTTNPRNVGILFAPISDSDLTYKPSKYYGYRSADDDFESGYLTFDPLPDGYEPKLLEHGKEYTLEDFRVQPESNVTSLSASNTVTKSVMHSGNYTTSNIPGVRVTRDDSFKHDNLGDIIPTIKEYLPKFDTTKLSSLSDDFVGLLSGMLAYLNTIGELRDDIVNDLNTPISGMSEAKQAIYTSLATKDHNGLKLIKELQQVYHNIVIEYYAKVEVMIDRIYKYNDMKNSTKVNPPADTSPNEWPSPEDNVVPLYSTSAQSVEPKVVANEPTEVSTEQVTNPTNSEKKDKKK